jgi:PAS domain S-box-containing protein
MMTRDSVNDAKQYLQQIAQLQEQLAAAQAQIAALQAHEVELRDQHRVMFDISHSVKLLIDPDTGLIVDANRAACAFYGYDLDTLRTLKITDINQLPPDEVQAEMQRARTEQRQFFNFRHRLANGDIRDVEVFSGPIQMDGRTLLYSIIRDVTERRAEEMELRLLWHAVNQSANSVIITDAEGRIEYVNPYFTHLTGYTLAEVRGQTPRILKTGHTPPEEYARLWQTIKAGEKWNGEFYNKKKNGEFYWESASISPVMDNEGEIVHFVAIKEDITARKQAEAELRASENRFRTLVNSTDDIVFTLDREGRHTGVFGRWLTTYGISPDSFLGRTARDILGAEAAAVHEQANAQALAGQSVVYYEWMSGEQAIQTSLSPLFDSEGEIVGMVGIGRDISLLKAVEQKLREAEQFARATVDALSAHIAILDEQGTILSVNAAWTQFAAQNNGQPGAVGVGVNYLDVLRAVDPASPDAAAAQAMLDGIQQVLRGEREQYMLEYPCHAPDEERWFMARVTRFAGSESKHIVVAHENITERVQAQRQLSAFNAHLSSLVEQRTEQLQRLNQRMTTVLNHVSNPVLLAHGDGTIDITNPAFDRKLGYAPDELFGQPLWSIFESSCQPLIKDALRAADPASGRPFQVRLLTSAGAPLDAEASLARVSDGGDYVICTLYDITHLKEMERLKDEFVSLVSHELRTPISSIVLSAETLNRFYERLSEEQIRRKLANIETQGHRLGEMVTAILDMNRLEARHGQHGQEPVPVDQVLREVVAEFEAAIAHKQQHLDVYISNSRLLLLGERFDLVRIWRNLISNAVKYTPDGGQITVSLYGASSSDTAKQRLPDLRAFAATAPPDLRSGRYIIGLVTDNGHGIRPQDMPQLFSRFFRGWATATNITGTGLGLSLVRDLLRLYGGDIAVQSELGTGTTFCFWLPVDGEQNQ